MRVLFRKDVDGSSGDVYYEQYAGLSSETKPTMNIATGSEFFEVDTGKKYKFDELTNSWIEQPDLKSAINVLEPSATASDIGKALIVKTVADGKVTSYEYGEAGGGSVDPQDIQQAVDDWLEENISNPDSPPLDRTLSSSSSAAPADMVGNLKSALQVLEPSASATDIGKFLKAKTVSGGKVTEYEFGSASGSSWMTNADVTITDENKSSYFTDCNDAPVNSIYRISASAEMDNSPYGMGISTASGVYDGTVRSMTGYIDGDLYTFKVDNSIQQFYVTNRADGRQILYFRTKYASNYSWSKWNYISSISNLTSSNIAIRKKMIAPYLDGQGNPTATDTGIPNPQYMNDPLIFDDFDDAPLNSIYQIDLDCDSTVMAHNPAPGKSSILITSNFAYSSKHGEMQLCVGLKEAGGDPFMYWRYGYYASGNVYTFTPWKEVNPLANSSTYGMVKVNVNYGIGKNDSDDVLRIYGASDADIKGGTEAYKPIAPKRQEKSVFYGLAKAAGDSTQSSSANNVGVYTETAKSKIYEMIEAPETISGSTPSITGKAGIRYICGECSTLSITAPASGCIDVLFESGSTPTVLTVTSAKAGVTNIKWPVGFNIASLDANTTYEINIMDGEYGVVCEWA